MNLYKITAPEWLGYDSYSAAIVAAESEDAARNTHPGGPGTWDRKYSSDEWVAKNETDSVIVEFIGIAKDGTPPSVILSDYMRG